MTDDEELLAGVFNKRKFIKVLDEEYKKLQQESIDDLPPFPLNQHIIEGVGHWCANCGSSSPKSGWMGWFGERLCCNPDCPNSKPPCDHRYEYSEVANLNIDPKCVHCGLSIEEYKKL